MATKQKAADKNSGQKTTGEVPSVFQDVTDGNKHSSGSQEIETFTPNLSSPLQESFIVPASSNSNDYLNPNQPDQVQLQTLLTNLELTIPFAVLDV